MILFLIILAVLFAGLLLIPDKRETGEIKFFPKGGMYIKKDKKLTFDRRKMRF